MKRVLGTAGVGLSTVVWALSQAAKGEWAFFALAGVLALATQLTIGEMFERRPRAAVAPLLDESARLNEKA
ncbi:MAG: hypothetical protein R2748_33355 [Bryobacterales bacterium]